MTTNQNPTTDDTTGQPFRFSRRTSGLTSVSYRLAPMTWGRDMNARKWRVGFLALAVSVLLLVPTGAAEAFYAYGSSGSTGRVFLKVNPTTNQTPPVWCTYDSSGNDQIQAPGTSAKRAKHYWGKRQQVYSRYHIYWYDSGTDTWKYLDSSAWRSASIRRTQKKAVVLQGTAFTVTKSYAYQVAVEYRWAVRGVEVGRKYTTFDSYDYQVSPNAIGMIGRQPPQSSPSQDPGHAGWCYFPS